jgi:TRAP transporter 4TM/12TM fusion protein
MAEQRASSMEETQQQPDAHLRGAPKLLLSIAGVALALYAFFWVLNPLPAQIYRPSFLAVAMMMTFILYRARSRDDSEHSNPGVTDWLLAGLSVLSLGYILVTFEEFVRRAARPEILDTVFGVITILLVLEATRRTVGWTLPLFCVIFLAYAYLGGLIPIGWEITHRGYDLERIVGQTYMGLEGIFGVPVAVAATYLILFTIYGAVLQYSGATKFFLDLSFAAFGNSRTGPGRTTTLSGYFLGSASGSGTATAVTLATILWPNLRRAGYNPENGGGVLAAAGLGAILAPPTMGAAAFIIAEFLGVSYLEVIIFAVIPAFLYYLGVVLAIEADARHMRIQGIEVDTPPAGWLLLRYGYYFSSLFVIIILLVLGFSPFRAVFYATILAFLLSFLSREHRMGPRRIWQALSAGALMVLPIAAVTASAGIIVAVITLTGLGVQLGSLIVSLAGGSLFLVTLYAAVAVLLIGLAVPVTASFIIAAVIIAPAFGEVGVEEYVAYMFIFYYAVLGEVSPPTGLAPFSTAAITGGSPMTTLMKTWKYTLPAFLVPFAFVLSPNGEALLLQGSVLQVLLVLPVAALSVAGLSVATGGWLIGPARLPERILCGAGALIMLYLEPLWASAGVAIFAAGVAVHLLTNRMIGRAEPSDPGKSSRTDEESA